MKIANNRGLRIPARIIISALLLLFQMFFIFDVLYNFSVTSTAVYTVSIIIGSLTAIFIMNRRSNPDHKMAWIVFILIFPIFGITVFLLWGGGRIPPRIKKRMKLSEAKYLKYLKTDNEIFARLKYYDMLHSRQADFLTGESGYPLYDKTTVEYLSSGEKFLQRLLEELKKAEKYISVSYTHLTLPTIYSV